MTSNSSRSANSRSEPIQVTCSTVGSAPYGSNAVTLAPRRLVCVDADPVACSFLRRNAAMAEMRVEVREGPMDEVLYSDEQFAVIIADPPWVPTDDVTRYPEDPVLAINGGPDGLDLVRGCLAVIDQHLAVAGSALIQVGPDDQADRLADLLAGHDSLTVVEVREFERGALVRVDRAAGWGSG